MVKVLFKQQSYYTMSAIIYLWFANLKYATVSTYSHCKNQTVDTFVTLTSKS